MAALNHVCMWSEHGWIRVSAEEAAKLHPGGTVSAHSGLFMCELCGQYVTLTDSYERVRHFRHSAFEESKNCPERTFGPLYSPVYKPGEHELPIRLICEGKSFRLELGFLYVPQDLLLNAKTNSVTVKASDTIHFTYSFERFNNSVITFLPIGSIPFETYEVISSDQLVLYWPRIVKGVSREGCLFDTQNGKMLTTDSDVLVQKKYYLLTTRLLSNRYSSISFSLLHETRSGWITWRLYKIEAVSLDQEAAKFFLSLHYRLTDFPLRVNPIWPLHIKTPYVIKHPDDFLVIHSYGQREKRISTFPYASVRSLACSNYGQISKVACNGRQQLISSGRANVLQYMYFWRESLDQVGEALEIQVQDINGNTVMPGTNSSLPSKEIIKVFAPYDGKAIIRKNGVVSDRRIISAQIICSIDSIDFGTEIEILIGLDIIWSASFTKAAETTLSTEDARFASVLTSFHGNEMPVPHRYGSLAAQLEKYPQTKQWLYQAIRRGTAPRKAMKYLISQLSAKKE